MIPLKILNKTTTIFSIYWDFMGLPPLPRPIQVDDDPSRVLGYWAVHSLCPSAAVEEKVEYGNFSKAFLQYFYAFCLFQQKRQSAEDWKLVLFKVK